MLPHMLNKRFCHAMCAGIAIMLLSACETPSYKPPTSQPNGVNIPTAAPDYGPRAALDVSHIPIPVPRIEPRARTSNVTPYKVKGKTYRVIHNPAGFRQKGIASWYGYKFHGKTTANGELYNMYAVTAAHKTLPIPSFVRVTNLNNNRSIIVRVNDRGPFHDNRIIDLSYTAAKKLDYIDKGTAPVAVEYIDPATFTAPHPDTLDNTISLQKKKGKVKKSAPMPFHSGGYELPKGTYLQMGAFSKTQGANAFKKSLTRKMISHLAYINKQPPRRQKPITISIVKPRQLRIYKDSLYRIQIGPIANAFDMEAVRKALAQVGIADPHSINRNGF